MSTRSIVARATDTGFTDGTYVHWDGYPTARGPILQHLFRQGTLDKVIGHPWGWSDLDPNVEQREQHDYDVGTMVPGIGRSYEGHDPTCTNYNFTYTEGEPFDGWDTE